MKVALILIAFATSSSGQLIYPDEFESMLAATARPQKFSSGYTPVTNAVENVSGYRIPTFRPTYPQSVSVQSAPKQDSSVNLQASNIISQGVTRFAVRMDDAVAVGRSRLAPGSRENIVFSPLSVAAALALVLLGSAGRTFDEVSTILGLNNGLDVTRNSEAVHEMFGTLISAISSKSGLPGLPETSFASGIFVQQGYPIRPEFKQASENIYKSEVINLDYRNGGRNAQQTLNNWVNSKTRGKIPSILNSPPSPETSVIIASALYFNGEWNQYFVDGATRRKPFTIAPGETVSVDMMYNGGEFPFFEDKQLRTKIVGLPYKGREETMYVVLPTDPGYESLRALERRLDPDTLENLIRKMDNRSCILGLPRMKLSGTLSLKDALQFLGLHSLFDPMTADLSLVSSGSKQTTPSTDGISFPPRFKEEPNTTTNNAQLRANFFSFDDQVRGYHVDQWATGFSIRRIARQRRRRSIEALKLRVRRSAALRDEEKRRDNEAGNILGEKSSRNRRQVIQNQYQSSYGIDNLRNNGVLSNPRLYADDVLHRVEIEVTETGTVAAAATAVLITKDGNQKRLVADRPFLFFIRHEPTGLILFWGSVIKPTPNYPNPQNKR